MTKGLKQIQEDNRKLILEICYGDLEEYDESEKRKEPLTLNKVLLTLKNRVFGNIDSNGFYHKMLFQNDKLLFVYSEGDFYWDLTQETLENQSEKTQISINTLLTN